MLKVEACILEKIFELQTIPSVSAANFTNITNSFIWKFTNGVDNTELKEFLWTLLFADKSNCSARADPQEVNDQNHSGAWNFPFFGSNGAYKREKLSPMFATRLVQLP